MSKEFFIFSTPACRMAGLWAEGQKCRQKGRAFFETSKQVQNGRSLGSILLMCLSRAFVV